MELSVTIEEVEESKTDPRMFIDSEDEDTSDIIASHYDSHTFSIDPTTMGVIDETNPKTVIKPKKLESRMLKKFIQAIIRNITHGRKTRGKKNVDYREIVGVIIMAR